MKTADSMTPPDRRQQRAALVSATMASFLTPFLGSSINVALPTIGGELGMNAVQLSWVATAFLLSSAVCLIPFGRLADVTGRKTVFLTGMISFSAASLACGLARHAALLIAFRAAQGFAAAMIFGTGLAILTSVYPASERGRVIGFNASAVYLGLSLGPFLGGLLTRYLGWPTIFHASAVLALIGAFVAWRGLTRDRGQHLGGAFDWVGFALYGTTLVTLLWGLSRLPGTVGAIATVAACVGVFAFLRWERRARHPMLDVPLLARDPVFAWSNVAALINYSATSAVTFLVSLYLQYLRGYNPADTGIVLLTQSIVMAGVSPFAGRLSDRVEPRIVASAGMSLTVLGLVWLAFIDATTPIGVIVAALMVLGMGFGLFSSPNTNAVMSSVEKPQYGVASATLGTMRLLGQTASMGLAAAVLAWFVGRVSITPAAHDGFLHAMRVVFAASAVLCVVGVAASLARGNVRTR